MAQWGRGTLAPFLVHRPDGRVEVDLSTATAQDNLHLIKKVRQWKRRIRREVKSVDVDDGVSVGTVYEQEHIIRTEIEIQDPQAAVDKLAKVHGLYRDEGMQVNIYLQQLEQATDDEVRQKLEEARQRLLRQNNPN